MEILTLVLTYGPAILKLLQAMQPVIQALEVKGMTTPAATQAVSTHYALTGEIPNAEKLWMDRQNATG